MILKAVQDADKSLSQKRAESRQKESELEEIHRRRMKATNEARKFKTSDLDEVHKNRMKATIEAKRFKGSSDLDEVHKNRMKATIEAKKINDKSDLDEVQKSRTKAKSCGSPVKITKQKVMKKKKVKRPPTPSSSSSSSDEEDDQGSGSSIGNENEDLRLRLENRRRKTPKNRKMIEPPSPELTRAPKAEQAVIVPEKKIIRLTKPVAPVVKTEDAELELIRQRALSSMLRNQQQKKIIIPLNETSSSEYSDDDDLSLSSNYSNTNAEQKKQPLQVRNLSEFFVKASI